MYIIFEGIDGCGKSTQIKRLCEKHKNFIATKEPGNTSLGKKLRQIILHEGKISKKAEFFLFLADRAEHYEKIIKANECKTILSDRGFISGIAYAFANDESLDLEFLLRINKYALCDILPQKIVFFQSNLDILEKRLTKKSNDTIEKRGFKYLLKVQEVMKEIIQLLNIQTLIVNSDENIDKITKQIEGFLK